MKVIVTLSRWGNSLAIRIPKAALDEVQLHEGDRLDVLTRDGHVVLVPHAIRPSLEEMLAKITPENLHETVFDNVVGAERL